MNIKEQIDIYCKQARSQIERGIISEKYFQFPLEKLEELVSEITQLETEKGDLTHELGGLQSANEAATSMIEYLETEK